MIVATWQPHEMQVLEAIRELGLELQVIFNKGAVMVLPSGINKATGLDAALAELGLSPHNVVGVGDAENDHAFLARCECAVAVANALPSLKDAADVVTRGGAGAGVVELIERAARRRSRRWRRGRARHDIALGTRADGGALSLPAYGGGDPVRRHVGQRQVDAHDRASSSGSPSRATSSASSIRKATTRTSPGPTKRPWASAPRSARRPSRR